MLSSTNSSITVIYKVVYLYNQHNLFYMCFTSHVSGGSVKRVFFLKMVDIPGFADPSKATDLNDVEDTRKKKSVKKSGGFQSMNLSFNVLKGITKRGYKQPTPIQRKV